MRVHLSNFVGRYTDFLATVPIGRRSAYGVHLGNVLSCDVRALAAAGVSTYADWHRAAREHWNLVEDHRGECAEDVPGVDPRTFDALDANLEALETQFTSRRRAAPSPAPVRTMPNPDIIAALEALLADEDEVVR